MGQRVRISSIWKAERKEELGALNRGRVWEIDPVTTSFNQAAQWYIMEADSYGFTVKCKSLGAGVKKIYVTNSDICPTCGKKS